MKYRLLIALVVISGCGQNTSPTISTQPKQPQAIPQRFKSDAETPRPAPQPKPKVTQATPTPTIVEKHPKPQVKAEIEEKKHWLNTKSNVRHNSRCKNFKTTKNGRMCNPDEGKACHLCGG